jgi:hypothetical protein
VAGAGATRSPLFRPGRRALLRAGAGLILAAVLVASSLRREGPATDDRAAAGPAAAAGGPRTSPPPGDGQTGGRGQRHARQPPALQEAAALVPPPRGNEVEPPPPTPPAQLFRAASPNPALTSALAAELARHRAPGLRAGTARGECRDRWCRLEIAAGDHSAPWLARLLESEWVGENLHEVGADPGGLLFERHLPGSVRSSEVLQRAVHDFEASGTVEACQARHSGAGTLDAQIALAPSPEAPDDVAADTGVTVETTGPLAGTPLGRCIDDGFRRALAAVTLPPRYEHATLLAQFPKR